MSEDIQEELGHAQMFAARIKELWGVFPVDGVQAIPDVPAAARGPDDLVHVIAA